jgi:hypothetical protein
MSATSSTSEISKKGKKAKINSKMDKEEAEEENARMYAAIAFAIILIVVGVNDTNFSNKFLFTFFVVLDWSAIMVAHY